MKRVSRRFSLVLAGLIVGVLGPGLAAAQIPDTFTNLQLLPKDITKEDLVGRMRGIAGSLGVRCSHCHVGPDNLVAMNFSTDEKDTKKAAREMIKMSRAINQNVSALGGDSERQAVGCYTCHRGQPKPPRRLSDIVSETATRRNVDAAIQGYKTLRSEHLVTGTYDFSERTLNVVATALLEGGRPDDALKVLNANLEYYPKSMMVHYMFGQVHEAKSDLAAALDSYQRALSLAPGTEFLERAIQGVKKKQGG